LPYDPSWRFPLRWFQVGKLDSVELTGETAASSSNYPWDITRVGFKERLLTAFQLEANTTDAAATSTRAVNVKTKWMRDQPRSEAMNEPMAATSPSMSRAQATVSDCM
jgi:hypothetical protein